MSQEDKEQEVKSQDEILATAAPDIPSDAESYMSEFAAEGLSDKERAHRRAQIARRIVQIVLAIAIIIAVVVVKIVSGTDLNSWLFAGLALLIGIVVLFVVIFITEIIIGLTCVKPFEDNDDQIEK